MATKEIKKFSEVLAKIGVLINENPTFLDQLEKFINSSVILEKSPEINYEKINKIELFQLIREKSEEEVEDILSGFTLQELRAILKKYHFGSPSKLKTTSQIRQHILNQLIKRKTDVFQNS